MPDSNPARSAPASRSLSIVLTLCAVALVVGVAYRMMLDIREARQNSSGGLTLATSGYDLSTLTVPREALTVSNLRKDRRVAFVEPGHLSLAELEALNRKHESKYVLSGDRVIGLEINGEAVAYPIAVLNWHEIVNDTVGGQPVLVSYCGISDSAAAYSRRVGGETLTFGFSGLVYESNTLLYDRRDKAGQPITKSDEPQLSQSLSGIPDAPQPGPGADKESLWSQLGGFALAGPLASQTLTRLPCGVMAFSDWKTLHPRTLVAKRDDMLVADYKVDVYGTYFQSSDLAFPVAKPLTPGLEKISRGAKDRVLLLSFSSGEMAGALFSQVMQRASFDSTGLGQLQLELDGRTVALSCRKQGIGPCPETVWLREGQTGVDSPGLGFLFVVHSLLGDMPIVDLAGIKQP